MSDQPQGTRGTATVHDLAGIRVAADGQGWWTTVECIAGKHRHHGVHVRDVVLDEPDGASSRDADRLGTTTSLPRCTCQDPDLERVAELVTAGVPQDIASRAVWAGWGPDTTRLLIERSA